MSDSNKSFNTNGLINNPLVDMATAARALPEFHGESVEDVHKWVRKGLLLRQIYGLADNDILRVMLTALRGEA